MISVIVDEEMFRKFKGKAEFWFGERFRPGVAVSLWILVWRYSLSDLRVFKFAKEGGPLDPLHYNSEFTEWLKVHRPEVFL